MTLHSRQLLLHRADLLHELCDGSNVHDSPLCVRRRPEAEPPTTINRAAILRMASPFVDN